MHSRYDSNTVIVYKGNFVMMQFCDLSKTIFGLNIVNF